MSNESEAMAIIAKARGLQLQKTKSGYTVTRGNRLELRTQSLRDVRAFLMSPACIMRRAVPTPAVKSAPAPLDRMADIHPMLWKFAQDLHTYVAAPINEVASARVHVDIRYNRRESRICAAVDFLEPDGYVFASIPCSPDLWQAQGGHIVRLFRKATNNVLSSAPARAA